MVIYRQRIGNGGAVTAKGYEFLLGKNFNVAIGCRTDGEKRRANKRISICTSIVLKNINDNGSVFINRVFVIKYVINGNRPGIC